MGIATMEAIVKTVGAILKTLECPICLDTLKTPVSAGCGHFFCRECASGILLSNYRAPCPLCKRSFTRRSIQEAHQRQTVIAAATALSETCSNLTGVNILGNCAIESRKSFGAILPVSPKSLKATLNENEEVISKKRKSCENEDTISSANNCAYKPDMKESKTENVKNNSAISDDECSSAKKRVCLDSDEECDLPSLEEIWSQMEPEPTGPECSTTKRVIAVKPLSIIPTDKISKLKTYSRYGKKTDNKLFTSESSGTDVEKLNIDKAFEDLLSAGTDENYIGNGSHLKKTTQSTVKLKNKINALKNKTNKVESDKLILQEDGFLSKSKDLKVSKNKSEELAKENELHLTPRAASNISSAKQGRRKLSKSQSSIHKLRRRARSSLSTDEEIISKINEATNHDLVVENTSNAGQQHNKVCFNLDEIAIAKSNHPNQTEGVSTDDPFKAIGLTDTAVTVDSVTSPLASKALSLHKSPGWSRVKKVKKDFKMRNFSSLQVEKNSPQIPLKNTASVVDSVVSVKEIVSSSKGTVEDKGLDSDHHNFENVSNMQNAKAKGSVHQTSEKEFSLSNLNKAKHLSDVRNEESGSLEDETDMNVDINNADGSEMNEKEFEKMDCTNSVVSSGAKHNISNVKENYYGVEPLNSDTKISLEDPGSNVRTSIINENQNISSINMNNNIASSSSFSPEKHDFLQMNEGNSGKFSVLENLGGLNRNSSINAAISERNDLRNESTISNQVSIYDNSTKHTNVFFGNDTPKLRKQKTLTVQAHISEYESLQPESLNTDKNLQYIEHSQQTSQVAFHYNNPNTLYNNLQLVAQQPPPFYTSFNAEKTKVVKRTCLTLEEVQDSFLRSNQSGCSETIYSSPFLAGQFKLHVCVADETLNISVLKVIDPTSESNSAHEAVSMISEKGIQTSNNVFHVNSPTVLPSSNSSSQPDNPNSNPFPFLSGTSNPMNSQPFLVLAKETAVDIAEPPLKEINDVGAPKKLCNANEKIFACENAAVKDLDMSEVIHFPESSFHQDNSISMKLQKDPDSFVQIDETTNLRNKKDVCSSPCKNDSEATTVLLLLEADNSEVMVLPIKKDDTKNIPKADNATSFKDSSLQPMNKSPKVVTIDSEDLSDSDKDNPLKLLHQCASKGTGSKKKQSRLSLKKKSRFRRTQIYDSSDESDGENCEMSKNIPQEIEHCVSSVADKPLGDILSDAKNIHTLKSAENIKNTAVLEMPSTLNSVFTEDAPEGNASEIILEIEDLSDKIKSLEEKLRQCGHSDLPKSQGHSLKHSSHNTSKRLSGNSCMTHRSDSEDSNDLFPQSVPPTPEKCVNEANPSFKSSFYT